MSPPATGFLSSTLSALTANAAFRQNQTCEPSSFNTLEQDISCAVPIATTRADGPKRRNRGKNLPKDVKRACTICKAEKTSQWRSGADGRPTYVEALSLFVIFIGWTGCPLKRCSHLFKRSEFNHNRCFAYQKLKLTC
jgi:hypothetical protein